MSVADFLSFGAEINLGASCAFKTIIDREDEIMRSVLFMICIIMIWSTTYSETSSDCSTIGHEKRSAEIWRNCGISMAATGAISLIWGILVFNQPADGSSAYPPAHAMTGIQIGISIPVVAIGSIISLIAQMKVEEKNVWLSKNCTSEK